MAKVDKYPKTSYVKTLRQKREASAMGEDLFTLEDCLVSGCSLV